MNRIALILNELMRRLPGIICMVNLRTLKLIALSLSLSLSLLAQDPQQYIQSYKDIAVAEMLRTGIPASIKLAQAMLESNCGKSELSCKANNHFGIKCGGDWTGKGFHKEDDDYKNGELTKSCFREFGSAYESFVAHSDFLTDPKKTNRYGSLFELKLTDYKSWAKGLSKAGYATDPAYADKLIRIIEDNELFVFDSGEDIQFATSGPKASLGYDLIRYNNDVKYIVASANENIMMLAEKHDVTEQQLLRYNDFAFAQNQALDKGTKVYLQPKRSSFHGKQKYHVLKPGQDLVFISQEYGIKLDALKKRNGIDGNLVPATGQKIMLKGKAKTPLKLMDPYEMPQEKKDELVNSNTAPVVEKPVSPPVKNSSVQKPANATSQNAAAQKPVVTAPTVKPNVAASTAGSTAVPAKKASSVPNTTPKIPNPDHVVAKGDTLYSIARDFGLSVDELKKMNNLAVDTIFIGQKLTIK